MIKNIYDKINNRYKHKYYCDCCKQEISEYGEILRNKKAIIQEIFDICSMCDWLMKGGDDE